MPASVVQAFPDVIVFEALVHRLAHSLEPAHVLCRQNMDDALKHIFWQPIHDALGLADGVK